MDKEIKSRVTEVSVRKEKMENYEITSKGDLKWDKAHEVN